MDRDIAAFASESTVSAGHDRSGFRWPRLGRLGGAPDVALGAAAEIGPATGGAVSGNAVSARPAGPVLCRDIKPDDFRAVAGLLCKGFPRIAEARFLDVLHGRAASPRSAEVPHIGLVLVHDGVPVGVLLTIASASDASGGHRRCNLVCWHVDPAFRIYAGLLVLRLGNRKNVTYINISPAPETLGIIEAQGFRQFSVGAFAGLAALSFAGRGVRVRPATADAVRRAALSDYERAVLQDHAASGAVALICSDAEGDWPLVFRRRHVTGVPVPCAQLVYCRAFSAFERQAGPVGRFLAMRGLFWILVAANQPMRGVAGRFFPEKFPMYYRGMTAPRCGDLAYTEIALFGF